MTLRRTDSFTYIEISIDGIGRGRRAEAYILDGNGIALADVLGTKIIKKVLNEHGAFGNGAVWRKNQYVLRRWAG